MCLPKEVLQTLQERHRTCQHKSFTCEGKPDRWEAVWHYTEEPIHCFVCEATRTLSHFNTCSKCFHPNSVIYINMHLDRVYFRLQLENHTSICHILGLWFFKIPLKNSGWFVRSFFFLSFTPPLWTQGTFWLKSYVKIFLFFFS